MSFGLKSPLLRMVLCLVLSVTLAVPAQARAFLSPAVTAHEPEDAFGNLVFKSGSTTNNYLYCGEQFDADLGLYYLRARYLNPDSGRFWSQDSYEGNTNDPESLHKYLYCSQEPVNAHDTSGHEELLELEESTAADSTISAEPIPSITQSVATTAASTINVPLSIQAALALEVRHQLMKNFQCALIGETWTRVLAAQVLIFTLTGVEPEAFLWDEDTTKVLKNLGISTDVEKMKELNHAWIDGVMKRKLVILDIGVDFDRASGPGTGMFYQCELQWTAGYPLKRQVYFPGSAGTF